MIPMTSVKVPVALPIQLTANKQIIPLYYYIYIPVYNVNSIVYRLFSALHCLAASTVYYIVCTTPIRYLQLQCCTVYTPIIFLLNIRRKRTYAHGFTTGKSCTRALKTSDFIIVLQSQSVLCVVYAYYHRKQKNMFRCLGTWAVEYRKTRSAWVICHGRAKFIMNYVYINYTRN